MHELSMQNSIVVVAYALRWIMIMTTTIFALMGVWLFYTMLGRSQVIHSCLRAHVCVLESPSASGFVQLGTHCSMLLATLQGTRHLQCQVKAVADELRADLRHGGVGLRQPPCEVCCGRNSCRGSAWLRNGGTANEPSMELASFASLSTVSDFVSKG
ncbi:unnamed protein product [Symbiodinium natans]|uniref:Uncharacterized protein n=1 Tax=Symbiodinium natans TaxID=878477 RepID=A0A812PBH7_9DINO|nr:unnamed protein product [Symbiodinium natans]